MLDVVLSAVAVAFLGLVDFPSASLVDPFFRSLTRFLEKWKHTIRNHRILLLRERQSEGVRPLFNTTHNAVCSIANSLCLLVQTGRISLYLDTPAGRLGKQLSELFTSCHDEAFRSSKRQLDVYDYMFKEHSTSVAFEDCMAGFLDAERRYSAPPAPRNSPQVYARRRGFSSAYMSRTNVAVPAGITLPPPLISTQRPVSAGKRNRAYTVATTARSNMQAMGSRVSKRLSIVLPATMGGNTTRAGPSAVHPSTSDSQNSVATANDTPSRAEVHPLTPVLDDDFTPERPS